MKTKRLYRSRRNSVVSGVCGGIGDYFSIDPVIVRIIAIVLILNGVGLLAYIVGALIIPLEPFENSFTQSGPNDNVNKTVNKENVTSNEAEKNTSKEDFFNDDTIDGEKIVEVKLEDDIER